MILAKSTKASSLEEIHNLNLWGMSLKDVSIIKSLPNVQSIALSVNKIKSLEPFSHCKRLRELFLRKNLISSLSDLYYLKDLQFLQVLWLSNNPITELENYRAFAIAILPHLTKLDEEDITEKERSEAIDLFRKKNLGELIKDPRHSIASKPSNSNTPSSTAQKNILDAISILLNELDCEALEVLYDQIQHMLNK